MNDHQEAKRLAEDGEILKALRIAAKVKGRDEYRDAIQVAWESSQRPDFYRSIGIDPAEAFERGIIALKARYGI